MKWKEIEKQYQGEWVFVEVTAFDEDYNVIEGNVLIHDTDNERFWREVNQLESSEKKDFAVHYLGDVPEDMAVML